MLARVKLQLHDAIYRLRFYSNSLIHILSLSNSYNNVASVQKNRGDKSDRVIVALHDAILSATILLKLIDSHVSYRFEIHPCNDLVWMQKNRSDKFHRVTLA